MKLQLTHWHYPYTCEKHAWHVRTPFKAITVHGLAATLGAVATALVIVLLAAWVSLIGSAYMLGAVTWGAAVVSMALAVDGRGTQAALLSMTAVALVLFAWLQVSVASGFVVAAAALVAAWVVPQVFARLK